MYHAQDKYAQISTNKQRINKICTILTRLRLNIKQDKQKDNQEWSAKKTQNYTGPTTYAYIYYSKQDAAPPFLYKSTNNLFFYQ